MRLVSPDYLSDEDREMQQILQDHPALARRLTLLLNSMRDLVKDGMYGGDPADIVRSLAKKENIMTLIGIPIIESKEDWQQILDGKPLM